MWASLPTMPDDDDSEIRQEYHYRIRSASTLCQMLWMQGAHDIKPSIDKSGRKDSILSILDNLALCLVRTGTETAAVSLFGKRLEFAGHDLAGQVPQACSTYNIPEIGDWDIPIEQITSGNAKIAIIAAQKEKVDSKSAVEDPTSDVTNYDRNVGSVTARLYHYNSNPVPASYHDIDFNTHARKVFSLLRHCLRESEDLSQQPKESKEDVYDLRMEFYRYVIGMSLPKLAVHTEQHDIRKFDKAVASIFHNVVSKLLHCIFAYAGILLPKRKGNTKTMNLAVSEEEFGYYLQNLVLTLQDLARFTGLPNGLKYYVESVKPPCDSSSDGASEDKTTKDEVLSHCVNSEKAIKDEQACDNDTDGAANAYPKETQAEGCCDVPTWRVKYQQWISSIVRQSRAISSLLQLTQKGHTQRIENLSFTPIHTDPPTSGMEDWIQTIKRALAFEIPGSEYENRCDRVIAALQGLCEAADDQEAYSWLDYTK
ncbi:MAG: hypothetical protein Q9192_007614 [Flavoplaca navasiana]